MVNQQELNVEKATNQKPIIEFDLAKEIIDIDTDEISFKPLTDGLGFNQARDKRVLKNTIKIPSIPQDNTVVEKKLKERPFDASSYLDVFEKKLKLKKEEIVATEKNEDEIQLAPIGLQISAWLIDVLVIFALMSVTMIFSALMPGMKLNDFLNLVSFKDMLMFSIIMFVCYYVLYFTIMDFFTTPGKYLLNIKVVRTNDSALTIKDTFVRSMVSVASFLALCVPLYIDFHGKISDTKVVLKNNY